MKMAPVLFILLLPVIVPPGVSAEQGQIPVYRTRFQPPVVQLADEYGPTRESRRGIIGIGVCYSGPMLKYYMTDNFSFELRDYITDDATTIAPRIVSDFDIPGTSLADRLYYGAEFGWVNFRGRLTSGGGRTAGLFIGVEKEVMPSVSLNIDAGPYWISIKDNQTAMRETGIDFVVNTSVCWRL